jgi:hypothetical protein
VWLHGSVALPERGASQAPSKCQAAVVALNTSMRPSP